MKRSTKVWLSAGFLLGAACCWGGIVYTDDPDYQRVCVHEASETRVDAASCENGTGYGYVWYYVPYSHSAPAVGSKVSSGRFSAPSGDVIDAPVRGGFGGNKGISFGG